MKVALVHDYLNEFGGAERVLSVLSEIFPKAPIYTAFYREDSEAYKRFKGKKIIASWVQKVPFFSTKLHSPLRFLAPLIWGSFQKQLSEYDVVITSASWYVTKGLVGRWASRQVGIDNSKSTSPRAQEPKSPIEICYCHTPPRYLYGYPTSVEWQKYWPVRLYALLVNHFMRVYDYEAAQRVDWFIANSREVQARIKKFYRRDSAVIYPPVDLGNFARGPVNRFPPASALSSQKSNVGKVDSVELRAVGSPSSIATPRKTYFLVVSRIVGGKGLQLAVEAANKLGFKLKVVGRGVGYGAEDKKIHDLAGDNVEFLGYVSDEKLVDLYAGARAFLALATDEDFGITPVEAMLCGTPVIAYDGGGYKETVVEGKTGLFFEEPTVDSLTGVIADFLKTEKKFDSKFIKAHAKRFSKERFKREILEFVKRHR